MKRVLLSVLIVGLICFPLICDEADAFEAEDVVEEITEETTEIPATAIKNIKLFFIFTIKVIKISYFFS